MYSSNFLYLFQVFFNVIIKKKEWSVLIMNFEQAYSFNQVQCFLQLMVYNICIEGLKLFL